ncbi:MAG: hypothetical protein LBK40_06185 [Spirochaetaceae bacterium]|jgi:hypothetical protein|nr:hypothetical protein [Spirochaetaceae bacterium]
MESLNDAFFFVTDKIAALQEFFWARAWDIGRITLFIALVTAAVNYALTGEGLKGNLIKIGKALVFFIVIMWAYPWIISHITEWTFNAAKASIWDGGLEREIEQTKEDTATVVETAMDEEPDPFAYNFLAAGGSTYVSSFISPYTYSTMTSEKVSADKDPREYFSDILVHHTAGNGNSYWAVAPRAALGAVMLVAGSCITFADNAKKDPPLFLPNFSQVIKGWICALAVMLTGTFAVLEYVVTFMEYMFVTSVGIILFPLSLWEGSKFMAEKLISAIIGFFIKLLCCTICMFIALYGFFTLSRTVTAAKFVGSVDQIFMVIFVSFLFFILCKAAPNLAQSVFTGTPSLSASNAIGAVTSAVGAAAATKNIVQSGAGALAGGAAQGVFAGAGMIAQAGAAGSAAKTLGASGAGAVLSSLGHSAGEALKSGGGDLARSLIAGSPGGAGSSGYGVNRHSQRQQFASPTLGDNAKKTFGEQIAARKQQGAVIGRQYMKDRKEPDGDA